jgi:hypothetical protein
LTLKAPINLQDIANIRREMLKTADEINVRRKPEENIELWMRGDVQTGESPRAEVRHWIALENMI